MKLLVCLALVFFIGCDGESEVVDFGSISLSSEEESSEFLDIKDTGSYLFKIENELEKTDSISLNIKIIDLMTSTSPYFRTHPSFVRCLQKIITRVQNNNEGMQVKVASAYKSSSDIGSSSTIQDLYATSGTGAVLTLTDIASGDNAGDISEIADAALIYCPTIFATMRQYLGVMMQQSSVHIHMTGSVDARQHYFSVDGYTEQTTTEFSSWAQQRLDAALDPIVAPNCTLFNTLTSGDNYPLSATNASQAVGTSDSDINDQADYRSRLVIYPGSSENIDYSDELLMSPRMFEVIRKLQYYVRIKMTDKLKINKVFAAEDNSLHLEGRQANIQLVNNNNDITLEQLSQLALCAGAGFVHHQGSEISIAVQKQSDIDAKKVSFPQGELTKVTPVSALIETLQDLDDSEYPLFDGQFQGEKYVSELTQVNQYMSADSRYLRLDPAIVKCYDNIQRFEKKWNSGSLINIPVVQSFLTMDQLQEQFDPSQDPRADAFNKGQALLLKYDQSLDLSQYTVHRLVHIAIHKCGPVFDDSDMAVGIGIYDDGIYIDMREEFMLWFGESVVLPEGLSQPQYYDSMETLYDNAILGRVVDPEDPIRACTYDDVPKRRSHDYKYVHPEHIQERRRRRSVTNQTEDCVVLTNTPFCERSKAHRDIEIAHIWAQFERKHLVSTTFERNLKQALQYCFGICGTCLLGEVYEQKTEHCNNLLHWADFRLFNEEADVTNFYNLDNFDTKKKACEGVNDAGQARHCLTRSPLYAIFASSFNALFRPDPTKSIEEELYGSQDNPSAVPELLYQLYAITANGTVTVWVENNEELKLLRGPLKVAMMYNKNINDVKVMVVSEESLADTGLALEEMIGNWVSTGCPLNTRPYIAPYTLHIVPHAGITKRDTRQYEHFTFGEQMLLKRKHFEDHWLQKVRK